jgi:hypothetical protein
MFSHGYLLAWLEQMLVITDQLDFSVLKFHFDNAGDNHWIISL